MVELARFGRGTINDIAFSPDGQILAVAGGLGVWLYEADTLGLTRHIETESELRDITWSPDGGALASARRDGSISIWNAGSGASVRVWDANRASCVAWSPDGSVLASGSELGSVFLWNADTGELMDSLEGLPSELRDVAWSPDGTMLAAGGVEIPVIVWNVVTGEQMRRLAQEYSSASILNVAWSPDGSLLAGAPNGGTVMSWNVETGEQIGQLSGSGSVAWSPDGTQLITGGWGVVAVIDAASGEEAFRLSSFSSSSGLFLDVAWSPDGSTLASGEDTGRIQLWDAATGEEIAAREEHTSRISSITWSPDGTMLASGSSRSINIWDAETGAMIETSAEGYFVFAFHMAWSPAGDWIAYQTAYGVAETSSSTVDFVSPGEVMGWEWSPDGRMLIYVPFGERNLWIRDLQAGEFFPVSEDLEILPIRYGWSSDGNTLAIASWTREGGGRISYSDTHTAEITNSIEVGEAIHDMAWSPDAEIMGILDYGENVVTLRDAETGELLAVLEAPDGGLTSMSWSADGEVLATGVANGTIILWDGETGEQLAVLEGHTSRVSTVAWSPYRFILASGGSDGSIRLWGVP